MHLIIPSLFLSFTLAVSNVVSILTGTTIPVCSLIARQLGSKVSFPSQNTYNASIASYWYQQERLSPSCVVSPSSSQDVATVVKLLASGSNDSAIVPALSIRSGGHAPLPGAANANDGVTIDLRSLAGVDVVTSHRTASVGSGAVWSDVYNKVVPLNLTVLGARVADLGVGGLITGGGISFYSPQRGFACDHVINMEVVLANGDIINANARQNSDLFKALKGGSNNFGIVTRFDLQLYPGGKFWGGFLFTPGTIFTQQLEAFQYFMDPRNFDPYAEMVSAVGYEGRLATFLGSNGIYYTKPTPNPPIFKPFLSLQPQLGNTLRISNISDFVTEEKAQQAVNSRGLFANTVFRFDETMIPRVYDLWNATVDSIKAVEGIQYFLIFQRVPAVQNGNSLGLSTSEGPLVLSLLSVTWTNAKDDVLINAIAKDLFDRIEMTTKAAGLYNDYKYLNYAAGFQDPIRSYGAASVANLQQVSKRYDPHGFFQTTVSGGFKLPA